MPKISIIVPVYNSALFLERCLDSIINQTFQDFELILIEDGSDDKSPQICKHYQQKDRRIQLFYEQHSGQSIARNLG
ncbi:glycosyltransferase, partial [Moraxella catarrhalis]